MEEKKRDFRKFDSKRIIKRHKMKIWAVVGFSLFMTILFVIASAAFILQKKQTDQAEKKYQQLISSQNQQQTQPNAEPSNDQNAGDQPQQTDQAEQIKLNKIIVDWEKQLVEVKDNCTVDPMMGQEARCFLVGKITNDDPAYKGKSLYLQLTTDGPGTDINHYIIEKNDDGTDRKVYTRNVNTDGTSNEVPIAGVSDIPDTIAFLGTAYNLEKHSFINYLFSEVTTEKKLFSDKNLGDIYQTDEGCAVAELPDHMVVSYDLDLPFINGESKVPNFIFSKGGKNIEEYDYIRMACGGVCTYFTEAKGVSLNDLEVIGKTSNGDNIYRLKNSNDQKLKDLYNDKNTRAYITDDSGQSSDKSKYSYDEFISLNPYIFWQDPLGRWIQFTNTKFETNAEMCKPVIYLYPNSKTDLDIKLDVNGGLTYTDPAYNGGWKVEASPAGQIKDLGTGKNYDSLLWEGIGLNYPQAKDGWVVKKENLSSFFDDKLTKLGLNDKEKSDFKEYWLSRLSEKPYYKISFLSQSEFGALASVQFSPIKPKVFIRVMMTAKGLDNYINIPEETLPSMPQRNGFTAVEWGGALLK
jgi:hypothetical protein